MVKQFLTPLNLIHIQKKLLLLCLAIEASSHVALYVLFSSAYLDPKWIRSPYLWCVLYLSQ